MLLLLPDDSTALTGYFSLTASLERLRRSGISSSLDLYHAKLPDELRRHRTSSPAHAAAGRRISCTISLAGSPPVAQIPQPQSLSRVEALARLRPLPLATGKDRRDSREATAPSGAPPGQGEGWMRPPHCSPPTDKEEVAGARRVPSGVGARETCTRHNMRRRAVSMPDCILLSVSL